MPQDVSSQRRGSAEGNMLLPGDQTIRRTPGFVRELIETVVLTAIVFFIVSAVAKPYQVDGPSMQPGLHTGDYVLVSPLAYAFGASPQRGDIIVFALALPHSPTEDLIKRVIGVPGDHVQIRLNAVYVNGVKLNEPYLNGGENNVQEGANGCGNNFNVTVGPNQYLVLGDNRGDSEDSRCFGSVPRQNIQGKAILVVFPFDKFHWLDTYPSTFQAVPPPSR